MKRRARQLAGMPPAPPSQHKPMRDRRARPVRLKLKRSFTSEVSIAGGPRNNANAPDHLKAQRLKRVKKPISMEYLERQRNASILKRSRRHRLRAQSPHALHRCMGRIHGVMSPAFAEYPNAIHGQMNELLRYRRIDGNGRRSSLDGH